MKMKNKIIITLAAFLMALLFFAAANHGRSPKRTTPAKGSSAPQSSQAALNHPSAVKPAVIHASFRPLNFALVRGGFTSAEQFFQQVHADPVLHAFYGDCSDPQATLKPLSDDILVFSTFRKGNEIKWVRQPLLVHKGEYVLTFCGKTVLARSGNLVSWSPMQPSENIPSGFLEVPVDVVKDPLTMDPAAVASSGVTAGPLAAAAVSAASASHRFFFIPPFYVPSGSSGHGPAPVGVALESDEFSDHQGRFTLLVGFFVIALFKLVTR
jgi:hypothetical protein